jgi:hypothetical protein
MPTFPVEEFDGVPFDHEQLRTSALSTFPVEELDGVPFDREQL